MRSPEVKGYPREFFGVLMGRGKDAPSIFQTRILKSPADTATDEARASFRLNRKTYPDYLIVYSSGDKDLESLTYLMKEGCRGIIIEDKGITSHGATRGREDIQRAMETGKKYDKVLIGAVENASSLLQDGQYVDVDLSDPNNVKIQAHEGNV